ncbi:MAG TPA: metallophosphoesterase, partial [Humisphaera sp.]
ELHRLLDRPTLAIYGNHDCKENEPGENDSVSILVASGQLRLLSADRPWVGTVNGCRVVVAGTCWGQKLPAEFDRSALPADQPAFVLWATHHDLQFPGYDEARRECREVPGVDLIVNGHIHRDLGEVRAGSTRWVNPGNITRVARSDASRAHKPGVLRVDVSPGGLRFERVEVPHRPYDEVFHPDVVSEPVAVEQSMFIRELAKLQSVRTQSGVGLREFLAANVGQFPQAVAAEINVLADEVLGDGK